MAPAQYDIKRILEILPHRNPFLLIDRVEEVLAGPKAGSRVGRRFRCIKNVSFGEPYFTGHFPKLPVMPGVLLVEAMAQAAALACYNEGQGQTDFFLAGVREAKFRRKVTPGDQLVISGEITRDGGSMIVSRASCHVADELAAEAEIMAKVIVRN